MNRRHESSFVIVADIQAPKIGVKVQPTGVVDDGIAASVSSKRLQVFSPDHIKCIANILRLETLYFN